MDPYLTYLLVVNALAFLLLTIDFQVCVRTGRDELIDHRLLSAFAPIGGGAGMLAAFLVWDRRVNKDNVAWRFMAVIGIIAWTLITLCVYGVVRLDAASLVAPLDLGSLAPLGVYLLVVNLTTLALFSYDKLRAEQGCGRSRVPEVVLLGLSLAGGAVGGLIAMRLVRHKTRKWYFSWGLPAMIVLQVALLLYLRLGGMV